MADAVLSSLLPEKAHQEGAGPEILDEYLHKLEGRRKKVLHSLYARVKAVYRQKPQQVEEVRRVDQALQGLSKLISGRGRAGHEDSDLISTNKLAELAAQHSDLSIQLAACTARQADLTALTEFQRDLTASRDEHDQGLYGDAAKSHLKLLHLAADLPSLPPSLVEACRQQGNELSEDVVRRGLASMEADALSQTIQVCLPGAPLQLWTALCTLGKADEVLKACAANLLQQLLLPMLSCPEPLGVTVGTGTPGEASTTSLTVHWTSGDASAGVGAQQAQQDSGDSTFEAITLRILEFLAGSVLEGHQACIESLGGHLWPGLASAYISQRLSRSLPTDASQLDSFQAAAKRAQRFEEAAAQAGWVPMDEASGGRIQKYVRHSLDKYVHSRRLQVVTEARSLLMLPPGETLVVGSDLSPESQAVEGTPGGTPGGPPGDLRGLGNPKDDSPLLAIGRYRVSCSAVALVGLMHRACAAAVAAGSPAVARSLVAAIQDAAELAALIPPATLGKQLQMAQPAALFYCDCQHLAREMLGLPYCYAPALRTLCSSAPGMLREAAARLREAGTAVLEAQVRQQCQDLADTLSAAEGWRWIADPSRASMGRKVAAQVLHAVSRLSHVLQPVLPPAAYTAVLSAAVETVCAMLCRDILALSDISMHESEEFPSILGPLVGELPAAVLPPAGASEKGSTPGRGMGLMDSAPSLRKLQAILQLMAARLAEFRSRWADGSLSAAGLSPGEVTHLVRALFEDTSVRRETLQALTPRA